VIAVGRDKTYKYLYRSSVWKVSSKTDTNMITYMSDYRKTHLTPFFFIVQLHNDVYVGSVPQCTSNLLNDDCMKNLHAGTATDEIPLRTTVLPNLGYNTTQRSRCLLVVGSRTEIKRTHNCYWFPFVVKMYFRNRLFFRLSLLPRKTVSYRT
jgi:hypothetical protein